MTYNICTTDIIKEAEKDSKTSTWLPAAAVL